MQFEYYLLIIRGEGLHWWQIDIVGNAGVGGGRDFAVIAAGRVTKEKLATAKNTTLEVAMIMMRS